MRKVGKFIQGVIPMPSPTAEMDHVVYVIFANQLLCFGLAIYSFYCSVNILFRKQHLAKTPYLSASLILYFFYIFVFALSSIIYFVYFFIFWRFDTVIYDAKIFFLLGIVPFVTTLLNAPMEWILCMDRCFAVIFHLRYTQKRQTIFMGFGLVIIALIVFYYVNALRIYFPAGTTTNCRFFGCFNQSNLLPMKLAGTIISLLTAIAFAILIKFKFHTTSNIVKRINKTILIIICLSTFNELIPILIGQIYVWVRFFFPWRSTP